MFRERSQVSIPPWKPLQLKPVRWGFWWDGPNRGPSLWLPHPCVQLHPQRSHKAHKVCTEEWEFSVVSFYYFSRYCAQFPCGSVVGMGFSVCLFSTWLSTQLYVWKHLCGHSCLSDKWVYWRFFKLTFAFGRTHMHSSKNLCQLPVLLP